MKKIIMALAVVLNCTFLTAQTEFDALKYVQTDINGTARYMGMAGAFGALGGDASAIKDNPAGLGIYRTSELVGTMSAAMQKSTSNWQYTTQGGLQNSFGYAEDPYKVGFNNFSVVIANPTWRNESGTGGLLSSNWSFSFNRLKNFNKSVYIKSGASTSSMTNFMDYFTGNIPLSDLDYTTSYEPFDNTNIPWLSILAYEGGLITENLNPSNGENRWESLLNPGETVTPSYYLSEKGHIDEYSIGWAGNFSNVFYFGATANLKSINYTARSTYTELFGEGGSMDLENTITTKGNGLNINIGTILRPTNFFRLGLSLQTPTIYSIDDHYSAIMDYDTDTTNYIATPDNGNSGYNSFQLQGPMQVNASAAILIGKRGLISAEYDYSNYTGTRLLTEDGSAQEYSFENQGMTKMLNDVQTLKVGAELKLSDNFALRGGYAIMSKSTKPDAQKYMIENTIRTDTEYFLNNSTNYLTAGFGFRDAGWFIDFAYMRKILDETYMPYNSNLLATELRANPASLSTVTNNLVVTLGLKF